MVEHVRLEDECFGVVIGPFMYVYHRMRHVGSREYAAPSEKQNTAAESPHNKGVQMYRSK
jgi:hypothetical protein